MRIAAIAITLVVAVLFGAFPGFGQEVSASPDIVIGNTVVFRVRGPAGGYSVAERVAIINSRIAEVLSELENGTQLTLASIARSDTAYPDGYVGSGWGTSDAALDETWDTYWPTLRGTSALFFANGRLLFAATPAEVASYPNFGTLIFTWQGNLIRAFCALGFNPYGPDPTEYPCR